MSSGQKGVWIELAVAIVTYVVYAIVVLGEVGRSSWATVPYAPLMLWAIGASVVATVIVRTVVAAIAPKDADKRDVRDKQIYRFGEYTGHWVLVAGAIAALLLAIIKVDYFWIANEIYLAFFVSSVLAAVAKLSAYGRGLPAW